MGKPNPARDIAISLGLAAVLGGGIAAYVLSSTAELRKEARAAHAQPALADSAPKRPMRSDEARRVAAAFVSHLASSEYEDAYQQMAGAYRQTTSFEAFRATCSASPFLSTARSVSLSKTREEFAPGQKAPGTLSATGALSTGGGTVDVTFFYVDEAASVAILNLTIAGAPALPMGTGPPPTKGTSSTPKSPNPAKSAGAPRPH